MLRKKLVYTAVPVQAFPARSFVQALATNINHVWFLCKDKFISMKDPTFVKNKFDGKGNRGFTYEN